MLDEEGLGGFLDQHRHPGGRLFRMERLPWYDVPSQNADRDAFVNGTRPDWTRKQGLIDWMQELRDAGVINERVRVFSADLTADELMSCHYGCPISSRFHDVRILHRGEHPVPNVLDHDYWITRPDAGGVHVLRMIYSDGGAFVGAEVVPAELHEPYLREQLLAWSIAEPFATWWGRHGELHQELPA